MSTDLLTIAEVTHRGKNALINELGIVDTIWFLNQFRSSNRDYTKDRIDLFRKDTVKSLVADIKA